MRRRPNRARLECRTAELEQRVAQPEQLLEKATRARKHQAGLFSENTPKQDPQKPGRKPGDNYGLSYRQTKAIERNNS